ncbi:hypothetical protein PRZ48_012148 [Zasmidium cellare]|uniref:Uncharacterized protein n=1 Tax=Zasmidium cellare TaxID=395010 RepID=A0ABR0E4Y7_ZASCE|nr:hypothetical protein PRZ48_012148 [Zasmidium cellare]
MITVMRFMVELGRIQGKIRTRLYGTESASLSNDERAQIAESLAAETKSIYKHKMQANSAILNLTRTAETTKSAELWLYGDEIVQLSTCTTAYSAIPLHHPRRFLALEAARECLRVCRHIGKEYAHHNVYNWTVFCHWVLLRVPLTPFTGVFYNIIANPESSQSDLELLQDYASCLKDARRLSEGIDRFYHLCSTFVEVAQSYVRAKTGRSDAVSALPSGLGDFGEQLLALGLSRNQPQHAGHGNDFSRSAMETERSAEIQNHTDLESFLDWDWYSSNISAYGLMDQDFDAMNGFSLDEWPDPTGGTAGF